MGASTARPVEANASLVPEGLPKSPSRLLVIGLVAAVTLLLVLGVGWMALSRGSSAAAIAPAPADTVITLAPTAAAPAAVVLEAAAPSVETPTPPAAPPVRAAPVNAAPLAPSKPPPAPATPFIPAAPAPRPLSAPNCDPPFTVNLSGHRVPKPECL
jgi:septal ring-binding cell division protein DamX